MSKEFIINEFLSLKLRGSKTFIYIKDKRFIQCNYILLSIPIDDQYNLINSIDELIDGLDPVLEETSNILSPETEFWAHSSNLQAWAEYAYNTDLLDSKMSFPLLKELTKVGDLQAKRVFKEEVAKRLMRGDLIVTAYLIEIGCLESLTYEEIELLVTSEECKLFENIFNEFKNVKSEHFHEADYIYNNVGKYFSKPIEQKLKQILKTENLEDLIIFLGYSMFDVLPNKEISKLLLENPLNLFERILNMMNIQNKKILKEIKANQIRIFSEKIEKRLWDRIRDKLISIICKGGIIYSVLWDFNLIKYLKDEEIDNLFIN